MDKNKKILIVDDEPMYINILVDLLSNKYEAIVAINGKQAIERAQDKPDLILLDVIMPEMDGYEVCKELKNNPDTRDIPVIFLTIKNQLNDEIRGFELGAVDYISKPMSPAIVMARVATHLKLSEITKHLAEENSALISDQKRKDIELKRKAKMAALGNLTSGIAHDFNNILGIIQGYADLLTLEIKNDEKLKKYTLSIQNAGERGIHITKKLLTYSREKPVDVESTNINSVLAEGQPMLSSSLASNIKLNLKLDEKLWPVHLNKSDLEDVILNININAMHAMHDGGELTIQTSNKHLTEQNNKPLNIPVGDYVQLAFTDTGTGMDQHTVEKIFDPFFTTKGDKGTGLGMSQVYRFVQQSSGSIQVDSTPGKGTEIVIYLPRYNEAEHLQQQENGTEINSDLSGNETILIVDDETVLGELIYEYLNDLGYTTLQTQSAESALEMMRLTKVDLLLSDVIMPGMDGYTLANTVQQNYPDTKIQMMSGYDSTHENSIKESQLYKQLLQKPVKLNVIARRIRELLDQ